MRSLALHPASGYRKKKWLLLGVVLGDMFPDQDNLVVAYATRAKLPDPKHYHRTFTHNIFTIAAMVIFLLSPRSPKTRSGGISVLALARA